MREYSTPRATALPASGNLTDDVVRNATEAPDAVVFGRRVAAAWYDVTAAEFLAQVRGVAKGLLAAGIEPGDRVALLSRTRYEWTLCDYAIWFAGAVTVPVYATATAEQVAWVLGDSGARAVVVEGPELLAKVTPARADLEALNHVWSLEGAAVDVLTRLGEDVPDERLEQRRSALTPGSLATLIYTSGTTGRPKGCRLTHGNFMAELGVAVEELADLFSPGASTSSASERKGSAGVGRSARERKGSAGEKKSSADERRSAGERKGPAGERKGPAGEAGASTLLFLPLPHVFARIVQVGCVRARVRLGHTADAAHLTARLREFRPTFLLAVPRTFERVFNTASQRAVADGRGMLFDRAAETAIAYSRAREEGAPGLALRARHATYSRLVYSRLRESLGGACVHAVSGGAPLGERLGHFYRGIGVNVLEGYGLTESTAALTVNSPGAQKMGTAGRPLPGTTVRVSDEGELLFRGEQVFAGYWDDEEATAGVLDADGWLHTGDLGEIDEEGFVRVTGRRREVFVTAGGKSVAPTVLEDRVRAHPLVAQCLVVGDGRPFVAALVTIDRDSFPPWREAHNKSGEVADLTEDPDLRAEVEAAVASANEAVSRAEAIRGFRILPGDWSEEAGHLTPSLKLRRSVVLRESRDEVEALYAG